MILLFCLLILYIFVRFSKNDISTAPEPLNASSAILEAKKEAPDPDKETKYASFYDYEIEGVAVTRVKLVCATRDWPRNSFIEVTNTANGKSVVCKVTDYGPRLDIYPERIVDLGSLAFKQIANLKTGVVPVKVVAVDN